MNYRKTENIFCVFIVAFFALSALVRLYPFENTLQNIVADKGNDWGTYSAYALDILHKGWMLPSVDGTYEKPASFFYSYFLAVCFFMFGENNIPVYFLQNLTLAFSVIFIWLTFCNKMSGKTSLVFLAVLFVFAITDVSIYYTFRFLGENLALFSLSLFFFLFFRGIEKNEKAFVLLSALFLAVSALTRPNIFLFLIVLPLPLAFYFFKNKRTEIRTLTAFVILLFIASSFLAVRNYLCCDKIAFLPSQGMFQNMINNHKIPVAVDLSGDENTLFSKYKAYLLQQPGIFFGHYFKKILFCFGFLKTLVPTYRWLPHWTLMWLCYFAYLYFNFREKTKTNFSEKIIHLYILLYFISLVLIAQIENYGFRMLIPGNFFVIPFAVMGGERIFKLLKKKPN